MLKHIHKRYFPLIIVHPLSEKIFSKYKILYHPISNFFNKLPVKIIDIETFLIKNKISHIFCTLSSPYRDLTNSNFIKASKKMNIPVFGLLDHWKGFDRFFNEKAEMSYFPDFIGCIDDFSKKRLLRFYNDPERIFIVGHPHLENILQMRKPIEKKKQINLLIISQPDTKNKSFNSIFMKKIDNERIIDKIHEEIKKIDVSTYLKVNYRPHPKETHFALLPDNINGDRKEDWEDALDRNDIFIGFDSMMLVEASLTGKYCISLNISDFSNIQDSEVPYKIFVKLKKMSELGIALQKAIKNLKQGYSVNSSDLDKKLQGSLERSIFFFEKIINI